MRSTLRRFKFLGIESGDYHNNDGIPSFILTVFRCYCYAEDIGTDTYSIMKCPFFCKRFN